MGSNRSSDRYFRYAIVILSKETGLHIWQHSKVISSQKKSCTKRLQLFQAIFLYTSSISILRLKLWNRYLIFISTSFQYTKTSYQNAFGVQKSIIFVTSMLRLQGSIANDKRKKWDNCNSCCSINNMVHDSRYTLFFIVRATFQIRCCNFAKRAEYLHVVEKIRRRWVKIQIISLAPLPYYTSFRQREFVPIKITSWRVSQQSRYLGWLT